MPLIVNQYNTDQFAEMLRFGIRRGLEASGMKCEGYAKDNCPVVSGRLRGSITHQLDGDGMAVVVGTNVEYAEAVHEGHRQEPGRYVPAIGKQLKADWVEGQPFLRNAAEQHADEYRDLIEASLKA